MGYKGTQNPPFCVLDVCVCVDKRKFPLKILPFHWESDG